MTLLGGDVASYASQFTGTPYVWGGNSLTKGIDCSGLVQQVYRKYGIELPRTTYDQIGQGKAVKAEGLRPGDLVFFDTIKETRGPDHVGIYLGGGKMVHAPRPGKSVEITDMTKGYYMNNFTAGRRIEGVRHVDGQDSDFDETGQLGIEEQGANEAAKYAWGYGFLKSDPAMKELFRIATAQSWRPEKFMAELKDTDWWKNNSAKRREILALKANDPATWAAQLEAGKIQVSQIAASLGAAVPPKVLTQITDDFLSSGMDEGMLREALAGYVGFAQKATLKGEAGMHEQAIKRRAYEMGQTLSQEAILGQAQRIIRGVATQQDFESDLREMAKGTYPGWADQLDAGQTVMQIASPYIQMMAAELELDPAQITVMDPMIKSALNKQRPDGHPVGMTISEFQQTLRNDPRWGKTDRARKSVTDLTSAVLKDFGLMG